MAHPGWVKKVIAHQAKLEELKAEAAQLKSTTPMEEDLPGEVAATQPAPKERVPCIFTAEAVAELGGAFYSKSERKTHVCSKVPSTGALSLGRPSTSLLELGIARGLR